MGRSKQLLPYHGKSFLANAVDSANDTLADPVIVVLGANKELFEKEISDKKVHIAENEQWKEGMASSIRCGVNALAHIAPAADAVIIMVCDQPFVSSSLLNELITTQQATGQLIVSCQYEQTMGTPALFHKSLFPELLALKDDTGAKKIIERYGNRIATVLFKKGSIDIDTEEDYKALK